ncbi:MAG: hypothetical protein JNG86_20105 [Verrucomicrobiaceae bacterium]|nr:hypothetical protein [Verrucomicrobiaceae bacterium]
MNRISFLFWLLSAACAAAQTSGSQFGTNNYVEYIPGDLPLILTSPHGGRLKPDGMPGRSYGVTGADANTQELTHAITNELFMRGGLRPHMIFSHLHRSRLDPNREVVEAAQGNPSAILAWEEYHRFIEQARAAVVKKHGFAFLIDMHGQNHKGERVELGYLHSPLELAQSAEILNSSAFVAQSSLALLVKRSKRPYTEILHGPQSIGALIAANGFRCTPSPQMPVPDEPYFKGGYTTARHCTGQTTGFQLEANRTRLRDTNGNRLKFARAFVTALEHFLAAHMRVTLRK